jgi:thioredoxin-like negative regulator of GroEL
MFYSSDEESEEREYRYLDKQLTQLAELFICCKFVRVDSCRAPLMVRKLNVKQFPTIVAMRKGEVVDSLTEMKHQIPGFVQKWFFKTGFVGFLSD